MFGVPSITLAPSPISILEALENQPRGPQTLVSSITPGRPPNIGLGVQVSLMGL